MFHFTKWSGRESSNESCWAFDIVVAPAVHNARKMLLTKGLARFEFSQMHMGVAVRLTLFAPDRARASQAGSASFARFREIDDMMSDYQTNSELNRLCRTAGSDPVGVSQELFEVLSAAYELSELSNGAFDVTAAPVVRLWRTARRNSLLPSPGSLTAAFSRVGHRRVHLDPTTGTVALEPGTTLDLGGIAKGYAIDAALDVLSLYGVESAMVEAGGDIAVSAAPPGEAGWRVSVRGLNAPPFVLEHQAVSTSGDGEQSVEIDGVRYSHIVDPRTGLGLTDSRQVTVTGRRAFGTDPVATAECVSPGVGARLGFEVQIFRH
jgi:thiamine biosynthesis lipoprotein